MDFAITLWCGHNLEVSTRGGDGEVCLYVLHRNALKHPKEFGVLGGLTLYYGHIGLDDYRVARSQNLRCGSTTAREGLTNDSVCGYRAENIHQMLALTYC